VSGTNHWIRRLFKVASLCTLITVGIALVAANTGVSRAGSLFASWRGRHAGAEPCDVPFVEEVGGTWYWLRSPEEEKRVLAGLFNRYCIRCHGVDGRGVWDIPDVPDFTNARWQAHRSDGQLARAILEGRGAVMPPFRGTLTLEESWALARYLRTFIPGTEVSRPDFGPPEKNGAGPISPPPPSPKTSSRGPSWR
jgi:mono/diheme cytochrome c family protein